MEYLDCIRVAAMSAFHPLRPLTTHSGHKLNDCLASLAATHVRSVSRKISRSSLLMSRMRRWE